MYCQGNARKETVDLAIDKKITALMADKLRSSPLIGNQESFGFGSRLLSIRVRLLCAIG